MNRKLLEVQILKISICQIPDTHNEGAVVGAVSAGTIALSKPIKSPSKSGTGAAVAGVAVGGTGAAWLVEVCETGLDPEGAGAPLTTREGDDSEYPASAASGSSSSSGLGVANFARLTNASGGL